jgi:hypothetical protein
VLERGLSRYSTMTFVAVTIPSPFTPLGPDRQLTLPSARYSSGSVAKARHVS